MLLAGVVGLVELAGVLGAAGLDVTAVLLGAGGLLAGSEPVVELLTGTLTTGRSELVCGAREQPANTSASNGIATRTVRIS